MPAATVTSKGQITIPAEVRRKLGLRAGSRVEFVPMDNGSFVIAPKTASVTALRGMVPAPVVPVSLEDMDDAVAAGAAERARR
ncbi:MAG TPA: AbrB/MazE/SpoVT family DNA-binding domain-containing protein [Actinomycetales bacterium]|nr:AbrB/MazE/SpoVT family DNA-binding domain-containing protein [Actinomycetales bacterium]